MVRLHLRHGTLHNDIQQTNTQHNKTQHKELICDPEDKLL
jgi:hypothetical protein